MYVYDTHEGTIDGTDPEETAETVVVGDDERRRSRFRTETEAGTEVGIVVGRKLRGGDLLTASADEAPPLVVALDPVDALVVDLADATGVTTAVALGHAAGNRHWKMARRGEQALFALTESESRMRETVTPHLPDGATVGVEAVSPALFDGAGDGHEHGHTHGRGGDEGHSHDHARDADADGAHGADGGGGGGEP
jgi:urease accessory protein